MLGARQNQTGGTSNGALLPAVNGATAPTGWGFYGEPTSTGSITTETGIAGNIFTITGGAYAIRIGEGPALAVGTDFVAGDRIRVGFMLKVSGLDINSGAVRLQVFYGGGVTPGNLTDLQLTADVPSWSVWTAEETVPAGATTMQFRMSVTARGWHCLSRSSPWRTSRDAAWSRKACPACSIRPTLAPGVGRFASLAPALRDRQRCPLSEPAIRALHSRPCQERDLSGRG